MRGGARGRGAAVWLAQLLTESLALCLLGGLAGIGVAYLLIRLATVPLLSQSLPFTSDVSLTPDVLAFAAAIVLGVVLLAGVMPALKASAGNLADCSLKKAARVSSGAQLRVRRTIVTCEVALLCLCSSVARCFW